VQHRAGAPFAGADGAIAAPIEAHLITASGGGGEAVVT
jgi:hypothetical protein